MSAPFICSVCGRECPLDIAAAGAAWVTEEELGALVARLSAAEQERDEVIEQRDTTLRLLRAWGNEALQHVELSA